MLVLDDTAAAAGRWEHKKIISEMENVWCDLTFSFHFRNFMNDILKLSCISISETCLYFCLVLWLWRVSVISRGRHNGAWLSRLGLSQCPHRAAYLPPPRAEQRSGLQSSITATFGPGREDSTQGHNHNLPEDKKWRDYCLGKINTTR